MTPKNAVRFVSAPALVIALAGTTYALIMALLRADWAMSAFLALVLIFGAMVARYVWRAWHGQPMPSHMPFPMRILSWTIVATMLLMMVWRR